MKEIPKTKMQQPLQATREVQGLTRAGTIKKIVRLETRMSLLEVVLAVLVALSAWNAFCTIKLLWFTSIAEQAQGKADE